MKGIFLDIETTGLDSKIHVPVDIAIIVVDMNNMSELLTYTTCITCEMKDLKKANKKALTLNGINPLCVWNGKGLRVVEGEILELFVKNNLNKSNSFFICQNPCFDRSFFSSIVPLARQDSFDFPYHWLDLASMFWSKVLVKELPSDSFFKNFSPLSKDFIASRLNIPLEPKPHIALNGANHLLACYRKLISL